MDEQDKYIDDLFHQKFSGASAPVPPSGGNWLQLQKVIRRKNFLRFTPASFNVYYLAAVATVAVVGSFVLPGILKNDKEVTIAPSSPVDIVDTLQKDEVVPAKCDSNFIMESLPEKKSTVRKCSDSNIVETPQLNDEANLLNDVENESVVKTAKAVDSVNTNVLNVSSDVIENIKPKIADAQPDTIVNVDTVLIKKKGVIFKRK
jgi:hypothetical protein